MTDVAAPTGAASAGRSTARRSVTVAAWTLVSRVTGLLRLVVVGAVLGPTFLSNAFLAANTLPNATYSVIAGPVLALVVVPTVVRALAERGRATCVLVMRRLSSMLVAASAVVTAALLLVSPVIARTLTLGVGDPVERARAQSITLLLLVLVAPQVVLYTVAALGAAAQQACERFALAAAAPVVENVVLIGAVGAVAVLHPAGLDVDDAPLDVVVLLGGGATLAVAVHAGIQVVGALRAGMSIVPAGGWYRDRSVREVAGHLRRSLLVGALPAAGTYLLIALSSTVRGGVLVFQTAYLLYAAVPALGARAVTTAVLPRLSAAADADDRPGFAAAWRQVLHYAVVTGLLPLCLLVAFARPAARTLAHGDAWTRELVVALALTIAVLGVAQLAHGTYEIARQALFARLDTAGPARAGLVTFAVTAAAGAATLLLPGGAPRVAGLGAAVLLADVAAAGLLLRRLARAIRPEPAVDRRSLRAVAFAACATLPGLVAGWHLTDGTGGAVAELAVAAGFGVLTVLVFGLALHRFGPRRGAAP